MSNLECLENLVLSRRPGGKDWWYGITECHRNGHLLVCQLLIHFSASDKNVPIFLGNLLTPVQSKLMWLGRTDYPTSLASEEAHD